MKRLIPYILMIAAMAISSCRKPYLNYGESSIVVEGWIEDGNYPVVMLTRSHPVTEDPIRLDEEFLSQYVITLGARVDLSDDMGNTVTLTGVRNQHYPTGYVFTTARMKGMKGHSYTLKVTYQSCEVTATTDIPEGLCEFASMKPVRVGDNYYISADVTRSDKNLGAVCFQTPDIDKDYRMCYLGVCHEGMDQLSICRSITSSTTGYNFHFFPGEKVYLRFSTMNNAAMDYYKDLESVVMGSHNAVFPVLFNISSNVNGGLGFFCGMQSRYYTIEIPEIQ